MLIVSNFDGAYEDYGKSLYASIRSNAPYCSVHFEMFNLSSEAVRAFRAVQRHDKDHFVFQQIAFKSDGDRVDYMANRRARLLLSLLDAGWQDVLWLDADSLLMVEPLTPLISNGFPHRFDLAAFRPGEVPGDRTEYLISTVAIANTFEARAFCFLWAEATDKMAAASDICRVQEAFAVTAKRMKDIVLVSGLPKEFCDYEFNDGSFVWEAHSTRKLNDMRWLNAQRNYLRAFDVSASVGLKSC